MHADLERLLRATAHRFPDPHPEVGERTLAAVLARWRERRRRTRAAAARRGAFHVLLAVAVAASFGVGKLTAGSPPPLDAQPDRLIVERGSYVVFHGEVPSRRSGHQVTVLRARCGEHGLRDERRVLSGRGGAFRVYAGPVDERTRFQLVSGRSRTGVFTIGARVLVTLERDPERPAFRVGVYAGEADIPSHATLQRFDRSRRAWTTVRRVPLGRDVGFVSGDVPIHARRGESFRAVLPATECLSESASAVLFVGDDS